MESITVNVSDKPRPSILIPAPVHRCNSEENSAHHLAISTLRKAEHISRKSVQFKRMKSLIQIIEPLHERKRVIGTLLGLLAALQLSLDALIIKMVDLHPLNMGAWRFLILEIITLPFAVYKLLFHKNSNASNLQLLSCFSKKTFSFLILFGLLSSSAGIFMLFGLRYLDVGDFTALFSSYMVFVTFASWMFLGDSCAIVSIILASITLAGIGILTKPPVFSFEIQWNLDYIHGVFYALAGTMLLTLCHALKTYLKKLKVNTYFIVSTGYITGVVQTVILASICQVLTVPETYWEIFLILISACLELCAIIGLEVALSYEKEGVILMRKATTVIFGFLWQMVFFQKQPDIYSITGSTLIFVCVLTASVRKILQTLPQDHIARKKLGFLLA